MEQNSNKQLAEVWGDTVVLRELLLASILGIFLTMSGYLIGRYIFNGIEGLDVGLTKGYSLLVGIIGCVLSGVISAKLFKPKRIVGEKLEETNIDEILKFGGMTFEEETEGIKNVDDEILEELKSLELYSILNLRKE